MKGTKSTRVLRACLTISCSHPEHGGSLPPGGHRLDEVQQQHFQDPTHQLDQGFTLRPHGCPSRCGAESQLALRQRSPLDARGSEFQRVPRLAPEFHKAWPCKPSFQSMFSGLILIGMSVSLNTVASHHAYTTLSHCPLHQAGGH